MAYILLCRHAGPRCLILFSITASGPRTASPCLTVATANCGTNAAISTGGIRGRGSRFRIVWGLRLRFRRRRNGVRRRKYTMHIKCLAFRRLWSTPPTKASRPISRISPRLWSVAGTAAPKRKAERPIAPSLLLFLTTNRRNWAKRMPHNLPPK